MNKYSTTPATKPRYSWISKAIKTTTHPLSGAVVPFADPVGRTYNVGKNKLKRENRRQSIINRVTIRSAR